MQINGDKIIGFSNIRVNQTDIEVDSYNKDHFEYKNGTFVKKQNIQAEQSNKVVSITFGGK